jgi:hypothetical protein
MGEEAAAIMVTLLICAAALVWDYLCDRTPPLSEEVLDESIRLQEAQWSKKRTS